MLHGLWPLLQNFKKASPAVLLLAGGILLEQHIMHECRYRRYVVEDRWTAIRWAIGTARDRDIVIIAGRGHTDFTEVMANGLTYRVCSCLLFGTGFARPGLQHLHLRWTCNSCVDGAGSRGQLVMMHSWATSLPASLMHIHMPTHAANEARVAFSQR